MASSLEIKVERLAVGARNGLFGYEKMDAEFASSDVRSLGMLSFLVPKAHMAECRAVHCPPRAYYSWLMCICICIVVVDSLIKV